MVPVRSVTSSDTGSTVITAHVDDFVQGLGPFAYLKEMPAEAEIIVTTDDGVDHRYELESVQNMEKKQLLSTRSSTETARHALCSSQVGDNSTRTCGNYSDNVVAIANPL